MQRTSTRVVVEEIHGYFDGTADSDTLAMDEETFLSIQQKRLHDADNASVLVITALFGIALAVMLVNYFSMQKWEKKALEERDEAHTVAFTDPLTGVKSRHAFLLNQKQLDCAIEEKAADEFAVVVCDVNGLKVINDTLGHKAGDEYIIRAGRMICDIFQHSPVFRTGGDEFAAILTGRDYLIRKELVLALHDRSVEHILAKDVVISGGLSEYRSGEDTNFHDVFERADALMYEEKKLLKGMGSITREEAEEAFKPLLPAGGEEDILRLKRFVLIVEDELVNQKILGKMLGDEYGILYASDGMEALEQIRSSMEELALVLLDLQMPQMDGLEVAREIRRRYDKETTVIILTAFNWDEIMDEALHTGVDSFLAKPLFASNVIDEFERIARRNNMSLYREKKRAKLEGRRILLAEDVFVNVAIMKKLIEVRNAAIDHAENGKAAVEMFQKSPVGCYDAILMDVRMPQMDGLEAAAAIRALDRPDAKTIPIIALTANAFDEDVQLSLQAGMNAHLSKPVEPEHLYQTLEELIWEKEKEQEQEQEG